MRHSRMVDPLRRGHAQRFLDPNDRSVNSFPLKMIREVAHSFERRYVTAVALLILVVRTPETG